MYDDPMKPRRIPYLLSEALLSVKTRYRTAAFGLCRPHKETIGSPCPDVKIPPASRSLPFTVALIICSLGSLTAFDFDNSTE